jgi:hypothetical protein
VVFCEEKTRLVANYAAAVAAYYSAVCDLETGMITGSAKIYTALRQSTENARSICDAALKELDAHETKHRCAA